MTPLIAGNWKMHTTLKEACDLARRVTEGTRPGAGVEVALIPPFVYLTAVREVIGNRIHLGAQDVHWEEKGAFTGEVSAAMLKDVGCRYVLIGHSERRHGRGENLEIVSKKFRAVLAKGMTPILCVGELLEERDQEVTFDVIRRQVQSALQAVPGNSPLVIAYEPVWAIGTGRTATPAQAQEVHAFIRSLLREQIPDRAGDIRILYGGSVKPDNIDSLMAQPDVNGALVGGASLDAAAFLRIIHHRK